MSTQELPAYVEYGGLATSPPPYACSDVTLFGAFLRGDHDRLARLCDTVFRQPSRGAVEVRPIGDHVMLTFGHAERILSPSPPFSDRGYAIERQVALWVPVTVCSAPGNGTAPRLALFAPYIWVDNPLTLAGGREVYGYPKNLGWIGLPEPGGQAVYSLDAYGGDFRPDRRAAKHRLIEMKPVSALSTADVDREWHGLWQAVDRLRAAVRDCAAELMADGTHLSESLLGALAQGAGPAQVFLKQFRSAAGTDRASSQQIVVAPITITRLSGGPVPSSYALTLHQLDSHPVAAELGVSSQVARAVFRVDMDFVVEAGTVVWDAAGPAAQPWGASLPRLARDLAGTLRSRPSPMRVLTATPGASLAALEAFAQTVQRSVARGGS